jgi:hypothetical protein
MQIDIFISGFPEKGWMREQADMLSKTKRCQGEFIPPVPQGLSVAGADWNAQM